MTRLANKSLCFTTVSPTMDIHVNSVEPKKKKKKSECNPLIYSNDFICTTHSMVSLDVMGLEICAGMEQQHACGGFQLLLVLKFLAFWNMLLNCAECSSYQNFQKMISIVHICHFPWAWSFVFCSCFSSLNTKRQRIVSRVQLTKPSKVPFSKLTATNQHMALLLHPIRFKLCIEMA